LPQYLDNKILDAQAWSCTDIITPELEIINLIYSIIKATKPSICIETNPFRGITSKTILKALAENKFGSLYLLKDNNNLTYSNLKDNIISTISEDDLNNLQGKIDCVILNSYGNKKIMLAKFISKFLSGRGMVMVSGDFDNFERLLKIKKIIERKSFECTILPSARGFLICSRKTNSISKYYKINNFRKKTLNFYIKNRNLIYKLLKSLFCLK
jgi:hypothetical protein